MDRRPHCARRLERADPKCSTCSSVESRPRMLDDDRRREGSSSPARLPCCPVDLRTVPRAARRAGRGLARRARTEADWLASRRGHADLSLFHEFDPPPAGGGHQFLRALTRELGARGFEIEENRVSAGTTACLFNSFNFDFDRLRRFARDGCRMVHRVDGPIGAYRGFDDGTDDRISELNHELADATVFQSRYSLDKHRELGYSLRDPVVIPNAVDPTIFHEPPEREPLGGRKVRLIATSWSDNPRKGAQTLAWLDAQSGLGAVRADLRRSVGPCLRAHPHRRPVDFRGGGSAAAEPRRVHRCQPRRSVLERLARGARVRLAGGLPRERRAPGARRSRRASVRR